MVMLKPIQFTMVKAVPLELAVAVFATRVENNGESAMTTKPQKIKNPIRRISEFA